MNFGMDPFGFSVDVCVRMDRQFPASTQITISHIS